MQFGYLFFCLISIFSKPASSSATTALEYSYIGCFVENPTYRLYQDGKRLIDNKMTVSICRNFCFTNINTFFSIQEAKDCLCGEADPAQADASNWVEEKCDHHCVSSFREKCGGFHASSVYTVCPLNTYSPTIYKAYTCDGVCNCKDPQCTIWKGVCPGNAACIEGWTGPSCNEPDKRPQYLGCYGNLKGSGASDMQLASKTSMKVERCVENCRNDLKTYAGIGDHKCYCGDDFGIYNAAPEESCTTDKVYCSKDKQNKCGNQVTMGIYRSCPFRHYKQDCTAACNCASDQCNIVTGDCPGGVCIFGYAGPKCDLYDQCFNVPCKNGGCCQQQRDGSFVCVCRLGYEGRQCEDAVDWANPFQPEGSIEEDIFRQNQTVAPTTTIQPNIPTFVGCFNDSVYSDSPKKNDWTMKTLDPPTIEQCVYYCLQKIRTYAGIKNGNICRCVQSFVFGLTAPKQCTIPCAGDEKQKCGGPKTFTVYTVCTLHFYLYDDKVCESRCNCLDGQCHASTGQCPSAMCLIGWSGPVCNVEGEGPEAQQKNYELKRSCIYASILCLVCGVGAFGQMIGTIIWWTRRKRALQRRIRDLEANKKADKKERHKLKKKWKKSIGR